MQLLDHLQKTAVNILNRLQGLVSDSTISAMLEKAKKETIHEESIWRRTRTRKCVAGTTGTL